MKYSPARFNWSLLLIVIICSPYIVNASEPSEALRIRREIMQVQETIESFGAVFELRINPDDENPAGYILHRELAVKKPAYVIHLNSHGDAATPWSEDIRKQRAVVTPDSVYVDWMLHRAHRKVPWDYLKETQLPGSLPFEAFFHSTGLWPLDPRLAIISRNGASYSLRAVAEDDSYALSEELVESPDGKRLKVLFRKGFDKLVVDQSRHCALMARELFDAKTGDCYERFELTGHVEVVPTVWLPSRVRHLRFEPSSSRSGNPKPKVDFTYEISAWRINDVKLDEFEFVNRPGELWLNPPDLIPRQVADGAEEYFDELAAWLKRRGFTSELQERPTNWSEGVGIGMFVLSSVVVMVTWLKLKMWPHGRRETTGYGVAQRGRFAKRLWREN